MTDNGNTAGPSANVSPVATMNNFAKFITDAAAAMQLVPQLEAEAALATEHWNSAMDRVATLEAKLLDRSRDNDTFASRLAEVERERDTFRQQALDAATARDRLVSSIETAMGMVQDDIQQLVPKPEPTPSPAPEPLQHDTLVNTSERLPYTAPAPSEPDPSQKYAGLIYSDYPHYVPRHEWIEGGGTEENYYAPSALR